MTSKQFCLKWSNFQTNILQAFESLQSTEDLTDVTLTCEGINVKAHKFILSAYSPYFRTVFKENPCTHPIIILKDVSHVDLIGIVNFMYHGEVKVFEEQLTSFLQTAKLLQVSGLNTPPESYAKKSPKKVKRLEVADQPIKKVKVAPKPKQRVITDLNLSHDEVKNQSNTEHVHQDVNENVEIDSVERESGSILEAALEKPESILERSLTLSGKSPLSLVQDQESNKTGCIPRKPPDSELDKRIAPPASGSSSPSTFERPVDVLHQTIKIEEDSNEGSEPPDEAARDNRYMETQAHHSSQCGTCPHCGKVYSNQSALKYHVRLVHSDLTNMYCCHLCPESFNYREGYKKHMVEVHCVRN